MPLPIFTGHTDIHRLDRLCQQVNRLEKALMSPRAPLTLEQFSPELQDQQNAIDEEIHEALDFAYEEAMLYAFRCAGYDASGVEPDALEELDPEEELYDAIANDGRCPQIIAMASLLAQSFGEEEEE